MAALLLADAATTTTATATAATTATVAVNSAGEPADTSFIYDCLVCQYSTERALQKKLPSISEGCLDVFGDADNMCSAYSSRHSMDMSPHKTAAATGPGADAGADPHALCQGWGVCSDISTEGWRAIAETRRREAAPGGAGTEAGLDVRISKAYGSRGYDKIRVTVISSAPIESEIFSYSEKFRYRWTDNVLNTGIVSVIPGEINTLDIAGEKFEIFIPLEDSPVRGVIVADPCFSNEFVWCSYGDDFDTYNRSTALLNAVNSHSDNDFWMILGDNFYDQSGGPTAEWFAGLTKETKSKVMGSVPGNHDFWILSSPRVATRRDQMANGFMQYYGQDVAASAASDTAAPYDFSVDPDGNPDDYGGSIPPASDFFWYYKVGNVGMLAYSGGHTYEEMLPYFEESCAYMASSGPAAVLLLGHWNTPGLGCPQEMNVPATYRQILEVPACAGIADKFRYMMGHEHCNKVVEPDVGFMVNLLYCSVLC
jgi:hypothetical protein